MVQAMGLEGAHAEGATPLDQDEVAGLIPKHINTQSALNEWEQQNILEATQWLMRVISRKTLLTEDFVRVLHKQMFGKTWRWAGTFRNTDKNIGVDWMQVSVRLNQLLANVQYQLDNKVFGVDEIAVRFHHDIVWIHSFPNGNGRHARLITDALLMQYGLEPFSWGKSNLVDDGQVRQNYLTALREADAGDFNSLIGFVRSSD